MMWPVGILAVLSMVAGLLQVPGGGRWWTTWLEPVVESVAEAAAACPSSRSRGIARWPRAASPRLAAVRTAERAAGRLRGRFGCAAKVLEHKFYLDELYDAVFYAPSVALANRLPAGRGAARPASAGDIGSGVREPRGGSPTPRPGSSACMRWRSPPASPSSSSSSWWSACSRPCSSSCRWSPGSASGSCPGSCRPPAASRCSSCSPSWRSGSPPSPASTSPLPACSPTRRRLVRRPRRLLQGRPVRLLALARRPDRS